ncbi:hypothetical protein XH83_39785 (plasmid) [Bradyrhizobium sp. CCBAU 53351]|uniref:Uncharacterized protein n=1 Tax=Bradyrhizobium guangdongense TaxID=1325090 RepID=A0ABX6UU85_9BRAD|nr:hypothetical protein X265_36200 [Bradyrhizobium guangdongense]QOZ56858.1 hypothetical protein XH90_36645 [Bradyrhizobium sp. CCBAU 53338]QOZ64394.1 hypothetical protein XH86_37270 [Bradyrhizobium guangdongense]QOZ81498.1 hypothetical protein XH83_39785 [Bradyrhizobium sp. CCBAU 53351]
MPGRCRPFPQIVSLPSRTVPTSCAEEPKFAKLLPGFEVQHADARGLFDGSIWPKTGCASIG